MPTVKEVDNRPVAVGKWPRHPHRRPHPAGFGRFPRTSGCGRTKCNGDEGCVHKHGNICIDVLLRPELLQEIYGDRGLFSNSSNPLLEYCLDGGYLKDFDIEPQEPLSALLELCSQFSSTSSPTSWAYMSKEYDLGDVSDCFEERLERVCQTGCDINVQSSQGLTSLHFLINGCSKESFDSVHRSVTVLLRHGFDVTLEDCDGNNSLVLLSKLLDRKLFNEAVTIAEAILQHPKCDANCVNKSGRGLLSYSVTHGDAAADLTRLLLNHGAQVLPVRASQGCDANEVARERESSAFTSFLRAVMRGQDLESSHVTLKLLCDALAVDTEFMRTHVLSTMLHLGQQSSGANSAGMASLFVELKSTMSPYWRQPLPLRYLCVSRIRDALGPKKILTGAQDLKLPSSLLQHLHFN